MCFLENVRHGIHIFKGVSEPTKRLAAQGTAYALCNQQSKQAFVKENKKNIFVKEILICKILEIYGRIFFPLMSFCYLKVASYIYHITNVAKYKASNCCKIEAVI